jgi:hypothetical protein
MICMEYAYKYVSRSYVIRRHLVHNYGVICVATCSRNTNTQSSDQPVADLRLTPTGHRDRSKNDISPLINNLITFSSIYYLHTVLFINPSCFASYVTPAIETVSLNYKNQSLLELIWHRKFKVVLFYVLQGYLIKPELSGTNLYTRGSFVKWKLDSCISS